MKFISAKAHTIIGLAVGIALLVAPYIFMFSDDSSASMVAMIVGAFIIVNEFITTSPASLLKLVPVRVHIIIDILTGLVLAASPWLLGFYDTPVNHWLPHLIVGALVVGYALMTVVPADDTPAVET